MWFAGLRFAERAIKYANFLAFEAVQLRPPFFCDIALCHRIYADQSFQFVLWPHVKGSVPKHERFSVH